MTIDTDHLGAATPRAGRATPSMELVGALAVAGVIKSGSQAVRPERLRKTVFQTNDIQVAVIVFVTCLEFAAVLMATNSTN